MAVSLRVLRRNTKVAAADWYRRGSDTNVDGPSDADAAATLVDAVAQFVRALVSTAKLELHRSNAPAAARLTDDARSVLRDAGAAASSDVELASAAWRSLRLSLLAEVMRVASTAQLQLGNAMGAHRFACDALDSEQSTGSVSVATQLCCGVALAAQNKHEEALERYGAGLDTLSSSCTTDVLQQQRELAALQHQIACSQWQSKSAADNAAAQGSFETALGLCTSLFGVHHSSTQAVVRSWTSASEHSTIRPPPPQLASCDSSWDSPPVSSCGMLPAARSPHPDRMSATAPYSPVPDQVSNVLAVASVTSRPSTPASPCTPLTPQKMLRQSDEKWDLGSGRLSLVSRPVTKRLLRSLHLERQCELRLRAKRRSLLQKQAAARFQAASLRSHSQSEIESQTEQMPSAPVRPPTVSSASGMNGFAPTPPSRRRSVMPLILTEHPPIVSVSGTKILCSYDECVADLIQIPTPPKKTNADVPHKRRVEHRLRSRRAARTEHERSIAQQTEQRMAELLEERELAKQVLTPRCLRGPQKSDRYLAALRQVEVVQRVWRCRLAARKAAAAREYVRRTGGVALLRRVAARWLHNTAAARAAARQLVGGSAFVRAERAASVIQALHARSHARRRVSEMAAARKGRAADVAATDLRVYSAVLVQSAVRRYFGRKIAANHRRDRQCSAVMKLWGHWSKLRPQVLRNKNWQRQVKRREFSAIQIQAAWRGFSERLRLATQRMKGRIQALRDRESEAATVAQKAYRGVRERRAATQKREINIERRATAAENAARVQRAEQSKDLEKRKNAADPLESEEWRARVAEAEKDMDRARQYYLTSVVEKEAERLRERFRPELPFRDVRAAALRQEERLKGLVTFARVQMAVLRVQRALRRWRGDGFSAQVREANRMFRADAAARRAAAEEERRVGLYKRPNRRWGGDPRWEAPVLRHAVEQREKRNAEAAAIDDSVQQPEILKPRRPPRAQEVRKAEAASAKSAAEREFKIVRAQHEAVAAAVEARLRDDLCAAIESGDSGRIHTARVRVDAHEQMVAMAVPRLAGAAAGCSATAAVCSVVAIGFMRAVPAPSELRRQARADAAARCVQRSARRFLGGLLLRRLRVVADLKVDTAVAKVAADRIAGLWRMRAARSAVSARRQDRADRLELLRAAD
eukprot:TRINITY_DN2336_c0_g1_i1.p1 TRINITY_DN2336_c0_g1~~TRINITY_DN2336_c0_g1_i1.p1  ORF type:complete len:1157 (+),score=142.29 TRINITY_DN2336_c0_g1_i1:62-3532(+)